MLRRVRYGQHVTINTLLMNTWVEVSSVLATMLLCLLLELLVEKVCFKFICGSSMSDEARVSLEEAGALTLSDCSQRRLYCRGDV